MLNQWVDKKFGGQFEGHYTGIETLEVKGPFGGNQFIYIQRDAKTHDLNYLRFDLTIRPFKERWKSFGINNLGFKWKYTNELERWWMHVSFVKSLDVTGMHWKKVFPKIHEWWTDYNNPYTFMDHNEETGEPIPLDKPPLWKYFYQMWKMEKFQKVCTHPNAEMEDYYSESQGRVTNFYCPTCHLS